MVPAFGEGCIFGWGEEFKGGRGLSFEGEGVGVGGGDEGVVDREMEGESVVWRCEGEGKGFGCFPSRRSGAYCCGEGPEKGLGGFGSEGKGLTLGVSLRGARAHISLRGARAHIVAFNPGGDGIIGGVDDGESKGEVVTYAEMARCVGAEHDVAFGGDVLLKLSTTAVRSVGEGMEVPGGKGVGKGKGEGGFTIDEALLWLPGCRTCKVGSNGCC